MQTSEIPACPQSFSASCYEEDAGKGAIEFVDKSLRDGGQDDLKIETRRHMERDLLQHVARSGGRKRRRELSIVLSPSRLSPGLEDDKYLTEDCQLTELIPCITLFDRPEHRLFEFLQRHVLRIAHGL